MKKYIYSRYLAEMIPVVAFNIVYFLLTNDFTVARWIGWICLHAAYFTFILTLRGVGVSDMKAVFGYPKSGVALGLLITTFVAFVVIFVLHTETEKWAIVIEVVATAGLGIVYFSLNVAETATHENEGILKGHYVFIATTSQIIDNARRAVTDVKLKKSIERAYDAVRNGNVISIQEVKQIENEVADSANRMLETTRNGQDKDTILSLVDGIVSRMRKREMVITSTRYAR